MGEPVTFNITVGAAAFTLAPLERVTDGLIPGQARSTIVITDNNVVNAPALDALYVVVAYEIIVGGDVFAVWNVFNAEVANGMDIFYSTDVSRVNVSLVNSLTGIITVGTPEAGQIITAVQWSE